MRAVVLDLVLFLTPFAVFFAYAIWVNRRRAQSGADPLQTPWFWLMIAGLVFAIAGFFLLRGTIDPHMGRYIPAATNADGKIVPGHYEGDDAAPRVPPPQTPPPEGPPPPVPKP